MERKPAKALALGEIFTYWGTRYEVTAITQSAIYAKPLAVLISGEWTVCRANSPWEFMGVETMVLVA